MDTGSARAAYQQALAIDPGHLPSIRALKGIQEQEKDWGGYEQTLLQEAQQTEDAEAKARSLLEVARYNAETKGDPETATAYYEETLKYAPDSLEAARPLSDVYSAREDWVSAERMLDIVVRKMAEKAIAEKDSGARRGALPAALPAGLRGGEAGQARQGARLLQEGVRPRRHLPAGARGLRPPAGAARAALRGRAAHLPDHPHPPPRRAHGHGGGGGLLAARRHPRDAEPGGPRAEPLREGAGRRPRPRGVPACAGGSDGQGGAAGSGPPSSASSSPTCWKARPRRASSWSWASSRARS